MNTKTGFVAAFKDFWFRAGDFRGSSTRGQYWWIFLIDLLLGVVLGIAVGVLTVATLAGVGSSGTRSPLQFMGSAAGIPFIVALGIFLFQGLPMLTLSIRRYQDAGVTPWLLLLTWLAPALITSLGGRNVAALIIASILYLIGFIIIPLLPTRHPEPQWSTRPNEDGQKASMLSAIPDFFRRGGVFSGRSSRFQYWWIILWSVIIGLGGFILMMIGSIFFLILGSHPGRTDVDLSGYYAFRSIFVWLASLIYLPSLTLVIRRFRDAGINPWWYGVLTLLQVVVSVGLILSKQYAASWIATAVILVIEVIITALPTKQTAHI